MEIRSMYSCPGTIQADTYQWAIVGHGYATLLGTWYYLDCKPFVHLIEIVTLDFFWATLSVAPRVSDFFNYGAVLEFRRNTRTSAKIMSPTIFFFPDKFSLTICLLWSDSDNQIAKQH